MKSARFARDVKEQGTGVVPTPVRKISGAATAGNRSSDQPESGTAAPWSFYLTYGCVKKDVQKKLLLQYERISLKATVFLIFFKKIASRRDPVRRGAQRRTVKSEKRTI